MNPLVIDIIKQFKANQNAEKAIGMGNYMKNNFPFLGLNKLIRDQIQKKLFAKHKIDSSETLLNIVLELWEEEEREFQYCAIDLLKKYSKLLSEKDIFVIEKIIVSKPWWDTVDLLASNITGKLLLKDSEFRKRCFDSWKNHINMWLRRTSIIFQLKYKTSTNTHLLKETILMNADSNEFFIQKAIGWALREYAKTNPNWVVALVSEIELKPLSRREALKHLIKKPNVKFG
jgi:3-methyladenine DNA glycosylase AlkD